MTKIEKSISKIPAKYRKQYIKAINRQLSPRQAIKIFCLECVGWVRNEAVLCTSETCPLYKYRPSHNSPKQLPVDESNYKF